MDILFDEIYKKVPAQKVVSERNSVEEFISLITRLSDE